MLLNDLTNQDAGIQFVWDTTPLVNWLIALIFICCIFGLLYYAISKFAKRKASYIITSISFAFILASYLLNLFGVLVISSMLFASLFTTCLFSNLGDVRKFIANPFSRPTAKAANFGVEKVYDRKQVYKNIEATVLVLSKGRIGAIMTFEKNTSLKDIIKNGVPVHAPVSPEILQTIFYPGTRLHDGAVVIHANEIVAASVFFTPSTKPFAGKYGSRHRAAIGVSEISDAVTVVVSEETGRISFAVDGQLDPVDPDNFLKAFETYMADNEEE